MEKSIIQTHSSEETQAFAGNFAQKLLKNPPKARGALVIALHGELGSGKTTFVQGFAQGLGIREKVLSPTFVILKSYKIPDGLRKLVHIDCYRIKDEKGLIELEWDTFVSDPSNIILVEWPEQIRNILPKDTMFLAFKAIQEKTRNISVLC